MVLFLFHQFFRCRFYCGEVCSAEKKTGDGNRAL